MHATWLMAVLNPATPEAHALYHLFLWTLAFSTVILGIVTAGVLYCLWRYRYREGQSLAPISVKSSWKLELIWTALPSLLILGTFIASVRVMMHADPAPAAEAKPFVVITGHQWWWEISYPAAAVVTANELHLPVGRTVLVELRAADVIHDWWVPELGRKMDAIPGHPNRLWMEAASPGVYTGTCAEFCGNEHAWMRIRVEAQSPAAFAAWLAGQRQAPAAAVQASPGAHLFAAKSCAACHGITGGQVRPGVNAGPNLAHIGGRATLAAGALQNSREGMIAWLLDPASFKPDIDMPNVRLSRDEATVLADYLESLK